MISAVKGLWAALERAGPAVQIRFAIDGVEYAAITAILGKSSVSEEYAGSSRAAFSTRDYLVRADDLPAGVPPRGSRIDELDDAAAVTASYTVQNGPENRHWSPVDQMGYLMRIHAVE